VFDPQKPHICELRNTSTKNTIFFIFGFGLGDFGFGFRDFRFGFVFVLDVCSGHGGVGWSRKAGGTSGVEWSGVEWRGLGTRWR
jgi:hypothetical protein